MARSLTSRFLITGMTVFASLGALTLTFCPAIQAGGASGASGGSEGGGEQLSRVTNLDVPTQHLTVYSGRAESLVGELIQQFRDETGIEVRVKYAGTGPLAALVLEEGKRTPADVFFAQDPGGLGVLGEAGRLVKLPAELNERVAYEHRDPHGKWIGVTGRLRTIAYSTDRIAVTDLPNSTLELAQPKWRGRVGWAPSNASFQAFVTAMRHQHGEAATEQWLRDMVANGVRTFANNTSILQGIADGEVDLGLVNHYYAHRIKSERNGDFAVANHVPAGEDGTGDIGAAMLISGAAILDTSVNRDNAERFIEFLLSDSAQAYFTTQTFEYPLANGASPCDGVPGLDGLKARSVDLSALSDLRETVQMLRSVGALR